MPRVFSAGGGSYGAMVGRQAKRLRRRAEEPIVGAAPRMQPSQAAGGGGSAAGPKGNAGGKGGKGAPAAAAAAGGKGGKGAGGGGKASGKAGHFCTVCGYWNFADRVECLRCSKVAAAGGKSGGKGGGKATCPAGRPLGGGGKSAGKGDKGKGATVGKGVWQGVIPAAAPQSEEVLALQRQLAASKEENKKLRQQAAQPVDGNFRLDDSEDEEGDDEYEEEPDMEVEKTEGPAGSGCQVRAARLKERRDVLMARVQTWERTLKEEAEAEDVDHKDEDLCRRHEGLSGVLFRLDGLRQELAGVRKELLHEKPLEKRLADAKSERRGRTVLLDKAKGRLQKHHDAMAAALALAFPRPPAERPFYRNANPLLHKSGLRRFRSAVLWAVCFVFVGLIVKAVPRFCSATVVRTYAH